MVEVKKRAGESAESLLRRFTKKVQQSGVLLRARKGRFYVPPKSKRQVKVEAIRRELIKEKKEYLKKIGKLDELLVQKKFSKKGLNVIKKMLGQKLKRK